MAFKLLLQFRQFYFAILLSKCLCDTHFAQFQVFGNNKHPEKIKTQISKLSRNLLNTKKANTKNFCDNFLLKLEFLEVCDAPDTENTPVKY